MIEEETKEHKDKNSAILLTFIKQPFVIKIFVLSNLSGHLTQVLLYMLCVFQKVDVLETVSESIKVGEFHVILHAHSCYLHYFLSVYHMETCVFIVMKSLWSFYVGKINKLE